MYIGISEGSQPGNFPFVPVPFKTQVVRYGTIHGSGRLKMGYFEKTGQRISFADISSSIQTISSTIERNYQCFVEWGAVIRSSRVAIVMVLVKYIKRFTFYGKVMLPWCFNYIM